jgi:hypothetical protein
VPRTRNSVYLVLVTPWRGQPIAARFQRALENLAACSELLPTVPRMSDSSFLPTIEVIDATLIEHAVVREEIAGVVWRPTHVKISSIVDVHARPVVGATRKLSEEEMLAFHTQAAWDDLAEFAVDLFLALNIAMPGMFTLHSGYVFQEHVLWKRLARMQANFEECLGVADQMKWPPLEWIELQTVWKWLCEDEGFTYRFSNSPLGRALCALSFLMSDRPWAGAYMSDLIWSMIALEALYGRGNIDMTNQLVEKTQLFLGPQKDFKSAVKKMYHYRSRLLHGDLDFPSAHSGDSDDNFISESARASSIASSILVSTLQRMVRRNIRELRFQYVIES